MFNSEIIRVFAFRELAREKINFLAEGIYIHTHIYIYRI